jgi:membrane protein required for colicin V production
LSKTDIILAVLLLLGAWSGYRKGFLMALFSLAAVLLGIFGAYHLMGDGVVWLGSRLDADPKLMPYISFTIIFFVIVIAVKILGSVLRASITQTILGEADSVLGAILGILRYGFMLSALLWIMTSLHLNLPEDWRKGSVMLPVIEKTAPYLAGKAGSLFPSVESLFGGS